MGEELDGLGKPHEGGEEWAGICLMLACRRELEVKLATPRVPAPGGAPTMGRVHP